MKKTLLKIALIGSLAFTIFSCSNDSDYSDIAEVAAANNSAVKAEQLADDVVASGRATIYSDLNPGYGSAVYFAGTFDGNWGKAYRGSYSESKGWYLNVETEKVFEWKALTGAYDLGNVVECTFDGFEYEATIPGGGSNPNPFWYADVGYGKAVYFVGSNYPTEAIRGTYVSDHWTASISFSPYYAVYVANWDLGETVKAEFKGLTWDNGDNNVYEYDGHDENGDGIVTRRALSLSNIDNRAVCMGTINAMTNAFKEQKIDGKTFEAVEMNTDLTKKEISSKIQSFFENTDDDDVSYIFINAHGGSDGCIALPTDGYLYGSDVRTLLDKYVRGEVVFIIESCHAGNIIGRSLAEDSFAENFISNFKAVESDSRRAELAAERFHVLCSSKMTELSWTWTNSIGFASKYWSLGLGWDGLAKVSGDLLADANGDSKVTLQELYAYSEPQISYKQTIVAYPDNDDFVIGGRF